MNIDPQKNYPDLLTENAYKDIRKKSTMLFAYANNLLTKQRNFIKNQHIGICLIEQNGCILRTYSNGEYFEAWAKKTGFVKRSQWTERSIGCNAIAAGLKSGKASYSCGKMHFCTHLQDVFIYFSPVYQIVTENGAHRRERLQGGIAIVGPEKENDETYSTIANLLADATEREMDARDWTVSIIDHLTSGMFILENVQHTIQISSCSKKILQMFQLPVDFASFDQADKYFDPLPDNQEFWQIVHEHKSVKDLDIALSVLGKKYLVTISTNAYLEKLSQIYVMSFIVTSRKSTAKQVTKRMGHYAKATFNDILGNSTALKNTIALARAAAGFGMNILLLGESGVGKDLLAQAIHNASRQSDGPFVPLNCAAIPRDLLASELFGYEHGAFTGAKKGGQIGKFELADGGTLFLDEIGDLPLELQTLLLRALEDKSLTRLGSNVKIPINVRIIAATNVNLQEQIGKKLFREDLYYRLNKFQIIIPPLRERVGDVQLLLDQFFRQISLSLHGCEYFIADNVLNYFASFPWHGNIRELQSYAEMLACLNPHNILSVNDITNLPSVLEKPAYHDTAPSDTQAQLTPLSETKTPATAQETQKLQYTIRSVLSAQQLQKTLAENRYNKVKTANMLGISRSTLYKLIREYGLE